MNFQFPISPAGRDPAPRDNFQLRKGTDSQPSGGLTLIEILISVVILGLLGAGLLSLQFILGQNQTVVFKNYLQIDEANSNVTALARELRTARAGDNGSYPLEIVLDQEIAFFSDIDFDGQVERVRYFLNGSQFSKGVTESTTYPVSYPSDQERVKVLSENIRNGAIPVFYYYNGDWPSDTINNPLDLSDRLSDTKGVGILLRLNTKADEPNDDYILESSVQIRILKDNL